MVELNRPYQLPHLGRIKGCLIQLECKVEFMREFGDHYIVTGRVVEGPAERRDFKSILHYQESHSLK